MVLDDVARIHAQRLLPDRKATHFQGRALACTHQRLTAQVISCGRHRTSYYFHYFWVRRPGPCESFTIDGSGLGFVPAVCDINVSYQRMTWQSASAEIPFLNAPMLRLFLFNFGDFSGSQPRVFGGARMARSWRRKEVFSSLKRINMKFLVNVISLFGLPDDKSYFRITYSKNTPTFKGFNLLWFPLKKVWGNFSCMGSTSNSTLLQVVSVVISTCVAKALDTEGVLQVGQAAK